MFRFLLCIFALLIGGLGLAKIFEQPKSLLIINSKNEASLPRNFRTPFEWDETTIENEVFLPDLTGFRSLHISGSAQFSQKSLESILDRLKHPSNFIIIDLRQEYHGFLDGVPVSWYGIRNGENVGKSIAQITKGEKKLLKKLIKEKDIILSRMVYKDKFGLKLPEAVSIPFTATGFSTEEELAAHYQLGYIRIPVADALRPTDDMVDRFITVVKGLPKDAWLHFHCAAGVGRTTSFMSMYDMMFHAKEVSFSDMIQRQNAIGGSNLGKYGSENSWKYSYAVERYQFLKDFHEYCRLNDDNFDTSWSDYLLSKK